MNNIIEMIAVDLGLSVLWADCNLGARHPGEPGNYYSWGEVSPKDLFSSGSYRFKSKIDSLVSIDTGDYFEFWEDPVKRDKFFFVKYNSLDAKRVLDIEDDAANASLGKNWRIPSRSDWQELIDNCDWSWNQELGVFRVVSRKNAAHVLLPQTGYRFLDLMLAFAVDEHFKEFYPDLDLEEANSGIYWTSDLFPAKGCPSNGRSGLFQSAEAFCMNERDGFSFKEEGLCREFGAVIRPIQSRR